MKQRMKADPVEHGPHILLKLANRPVSSAIVRGRDMLAVLIAVTRLVCGAPTVARSNLERLAELRANWFQNIQGEESVRLYRCFGHRAFLFEFFALEMFTQLHRVLFK